MHHEKDEIPKGREVFVLTLNGLWCLITSECAFAGACVTFPVVTLLQDHDCSLASLHLLARGNVTFTQRSSSRTRPLAHQPLLLRLHQETILPFAA